jgi:outer membrane biosynthesis protein TonB
MSRGRSCFLIWSGAGLALVFVLGACTPGGQFDPTEVVSTDLFNTKKKLGGDREPLFPQGVPGAETGVPPDLVKGYQPPPEPVAAADADAAAKAAATAEKPKPKPKPKPKVARAPAPTPQPQDPVWNQSAQSAAPPPARQPGQSAWPGPPPPQQPAQTNWPAPPGTQSSQAAPGAQTNWPAPPPTRQTQ